MRILTWPCVAAPAAIVAAVASTAVTTCTRGSLQQHEVSREGVRAGRAVGRACRATSSVPMLGPARSRLRRLRHHMLAHKLLEVRTSNSYVRCASNAMCGHPIASHDGAVHVTSTMVDSARRSHQARAHVRAVTAHPCILGASLRNHETCFHITPYCSSCWLLGDV